MKFKPSKFQQDIFDWVESGSGSGVFVESCGGYSQWQDASHARAVTPSGGRCVRAK